MRQALRTFRKVEKRKFVSQMSAKEKLQLHSKLNDVPLNNWKLTDHCLDMLDERNIYAFRKDILEVLNHYELIEYKQVHSYNDMRERIIVRDLNKTVGSYNLNVVFDITNESVISVWLNHFEDRHATLDLGNYDAGLKII